jgi:hypothetical protein
MTETLVLPDRHGGSPRVLLGCWRVDRVKRRFTATSVMGGIDRSSPGKWIRVSVVSRFASELQGVGVQASLGQNNSRVS